MIIKRWPFRVQPTTPGHEVPLEYYAAAVADIFGPRPTHAGQMTAAHNMTQMSWANRGDYSIFGPMSRLFAQMGTDLKALTPLLGQMFKASLPFARMWLEIMFQAAKAILPSFIVVMKALTPYLPMITKGFVALAQGVGAFITRLGPGMKAGSEIFLGIMKAIGITLDGTGLLLGKLGEVAAVWLKRWTHGFDIAKANTKRWAEDTRGIWDNFRHWTANEFDAIRQTVGMLWDSMWSHTWDATVRGVSHVVTWFDHMRKDIYTTVDHLPGQLWHLAVDMLTELVHGAQSVADKVLGFFRGIGHGIMSALHSVFHFGSPSKTMYQYGQWIVEGLAHGISSRMNMLGGHVNVMGHSVVGWIKQSLAFAHEPMSWLPALTRLVSLESGGNRFAVDPIAVMGEHASGMWQMLPSTFSQWSAGGSLWNPVAEGIAALRYISATYGSPFAIPGLFSGQYKGYSGGGWITEPVIGMGLHSGAGYTFGERESEYVSPGGRGAPRGGDIYITVQGDTNPDAAAQRIWHLLRDYKRHHGHQALGLA